jgi:hypothetical protein
MTIASRLVIVMFALCGSWALAGCGTAGDAGSVTNLGAGSSPEAAQDAGRVVDPARIVKALRHTGLVIQFRTGTKPQAFTAAVYGTAKNIRGVRVQFGFFIRPHADAPDYATGALRKLVPHATESGTSAADSFVFVSSSGSGRSRGSRVEGEEGAISATLEKAVSRLAPTAFREEGP